MEVMQKIMKAFNKNRRLSAVRKVNTVLIFCVIFLLMCIDVSAEQNDTYTDDYYGKQLEASGADELEESLPEETLELMEELGIEGIDFDEIFNATPEAFFKLAAGIVKGGAEKPLKAGITVAAILLILSVSESFVDKNGKLGKTVQMIGCVFILVCISAFVFDSVKAAVSAVKVGTGFMGVLTPVLTSVLIASGSPAQALSFRTVAFLVSQALSGIVSNIVVPVCGMVLAMGIADIFLPSSGLSSVAQTVKNTALWVFTSAATLMSGFISLKGIMARSADSIGARGIKLIIKTVVPVVGSSISDAYGSIAGSRSLLKTAVGTFGITALILIALPIVLSLGVWTAVLNLTSGFAAMLEEKSAEQFLKVLASVVTLLNVCVIFCTVILVISVGITLSFVYA